MSVPGDGGRQGAGRIAVQPDLVREHLVGPIRSRALELMEERPVEALEPGWEEARRALAPEVGANEQADRLARSLARAGHAAREAELELFEPAREPMPWLALKISERVEAGREPETARREACVELALSEPEERPSPDSGAASWRIPGPGAHVRHLVALETADELIGAGGRAPTGLERRRDVKRCWLYGLLVRCAEQAGPPQGPAETVSGGEPA